VILPFLIFVSASRLLLYRHYILYFMYYIIYVCATIKRRVSKYTIHSHQIPICLSIKENYMQVCFRTDKSHKHLYFQSMSTYNSSPTPNEFPTHRNGLAIRVLKAYLTIKVLAITQLSHKTTESLQTNAHFLLFILSYLVWPILNILLNNLSVLSKCPVHHVLRFPLFVLYLLLSHIDLSGILIRFL